MARIAEDLLLLLLDNASAQPAMNRGQVPRVLAAAVLLDLAYACRVRPALPEEPISAGHLVVLAGPPPFDPVVRPALAVLERAPIAASAAISKLSKRAEDDVLDQLLRTGQIRQVSLNTTRFARKAYAWPIADRSRTQAVRSAVLAALFDHDQPDPHTATIVALLHTTGSLGTLLSLNDRGWQWVHDRANEISRGSWVDDAKIADVNLAVTTAQILRALA
jgi:hypothetical protein